MKSGESWGGHSPVSCLLPPTMLPLTSSQDGPSPAELKVPYFHWQQNNYFRFYFIFNTPSHSQSSTWFLNNRLGKQSAQKASIPQGFWKRLFYFCGEEQPTGGEEGKALSFVSSAGIPHMPVCIQLTEKLHRQEMTGKTLTFIQDELKTLFFTLSMCFWCQTWVKTFS